MLSECIVKMEDLAGKIKDTLFWRERQLFGGREDTLTHTHTQNSALSTSVIRCTQFNANNDDGGVRKIHRPYGILVPLIPILLMTPC